jgi:outer membrane protein
MRRICPGLALLAILALPAQAQQIHLGTIDLHKVFDKYYKKIQAEAALKEREAELTKEEQAYVDDYNKTKEDYTKLLAAANDQTLSTEERDKRKSAAENKLQEIKSSENTIRTFEANARDQLDTQRKRMRDTLLQDIQDAVRAKAKSAGYTMVIDVSAESISGGPIVPFTNGDNDITDAILTQLNAGAPPPPADSPKDSDKKGDKKKKD